MQELHESKEGMCTDGGGDGEQEEAGSGQRRYSRAGEEEKGRERARDE